MGPLRGANHPYHGAPPFGLPRGIGCDVVRSTIVAARRADVPAAGEGELNRV